jgi:predicted transposase YbfD/YdcC
LNWIKSVEKVTTKEIVAIDGKTLRRSYDRKTSKSAIHMISAWANSSGLVLGQQKVDEKSNEITAIPELLTLLELKGCIVTIDAMGCQKEIVSKISEKEADYVIAVKKNQRTLYDNIKNTFTQAITNPNDFELSSYNTEEFGHGREEIRKYSMLTNVNQLVDPEEKWKNLASVGMVCSQRIINGKRSLETRYYISSLKLNAEEMASAIRNHWGVENSFHWILDVAFNEDNSRIRSGNAPQNFAVLRHIAVNLLKQEKSQKTGIKNKRLKAGWDNQYLERILNLS